MNLTQAALGGKSSDNPDEIGIDNGDGIEDLTDEQLAMWKEVLGEEDFQKQYGDRL